MGHTLSFRLRPEVDAVLVLRSLGELHVPWDDESRLPYVEAEGGCLQMDLPSHCQGWHREDAWATMRWLALKGGEPKVFERLSSLGPIPWLLYEGHDEVPIIVVNGPREGMRMSPDQRCLAVCPLGVPVLPSSVLDSVWMDVFDEMPAPFRERVDTALAEARNKAASRPGGRAERARATREVKVRMGRQRVEAGLNRIRDRLQELDEAFPDRAFSRRL